METGDSSEVKAVADEILCYLSKHPESGDTLDGVVQWWLIHERYLRGLNQVQRALDFLVTNGLIIERIGVDRRKIYSAHSKPSNDKNKSQS